MMRRRGFRDGWVWLAAGLVLGGGILACDEDPVDADLGLEGGVLATFRVGTEQFKVWAVDSAAVASLLALESGTSLANIPNGAIRQGSGLASHNAPWSWHLDPQDIQMAENTIEVCDGQPSYVEAHLADFLQIGRYCPWGATLVDVEDLR